MIKQNKLIPTLLVVTSVVMLSAACSSNNCPLDNSVSCNYYFYDSQDHAISIGDTLSVSILLPGHDTLYTYRLAGYTTIESRTRIDSLIEQGYKELVSVTRHDSTIINQVSGVAYLQLPMAYFNTADTLVFHYASITNNDTLYIEHDNMPHVGLPECGSYMFHNIKSVKSTDYAIERIEISNSNVNYEGKENIKIHFAGTLE